MGILPMDQLAKRIQEAKSANSFDALQEETLDHVPMTLLDAQKIKELMTAPKHVLGPQKTKAVQEFIKANAHKFDEATWARIISLCKLKTKSIAQRLGRAHAYLKSKPTVKQLGDTHAYPKSKPTAKQMGDALKEQIQTMDEDTKIRTLNELIPKDGCDIQKIETLAKAFRLDSVFVNKSNSVQVQFMLVSYKRETKEIGLLDTGATKNFIDSETVKKLRLGMKELPYQRPVFNVDGTPNRQGKISHYCDLMVSKGNVQRQLCFIVTNLGRDRFLFGYPWFKAFKPDIDREAGTLLGPKVKVETIRKTTWDKAQGYLKEKQQKQEDNNLIMETHEAIMEELEDQSQPNVWIRRTTMEINRTHNATEMAHKYAEQNKKEEIKLPEEFK